MRLSCALEWASCRRWDKLQGRQGVVDQVIKNLQYLRTGAIDCQFVQDGQQAVLPKNASDEQAVVNIGLAISGGVDSMALAYLCSLLQSNLRKLPAKVRFRAFVVDHGVRSESSTEAQAVAKVLESRDISTSVLKIEWPKDLDAKAAPNFESLARTYRFQALGRACRDHDVDTLFLAHHQDDQAETLLMRLVNGHGRRGLLGMNESAPIPECHGIYGVDHGGGELLHNAYGFLSMGHDGDHMSIESGGVRVYRPLLSFSKQELRKTCEENEMPWFEDHTNIDPTITMRNAIRHIYAHHKLPVALQKPALLSMLDRLRLQREEAQRRKGKMWSACKIRPMEFDKRFPRLYLAIERLSIAEIQDKQTTTLLLEVLRDRVQMVSGQQTIDLQGLLPVLRTIFPQLNKDGRSSTPPRAFTKAGMQFEPCSYTRHDGQQAGWILTPQKAYRGREPCLDIPPLPQPQAGKTPFPHTHKQSDIDDAIAYDPEKWHLYDGRWWVTFANHSNVNLQLRPFISLPKTDPITHKENKELVRKLKEKIEVLNEDKSKWYQQSQSGGEWRLADVKHSLPMLVIAGKPNSAQQGAAVHCDSDAPTGKIVAFPTLKIEDWEWYRKRNFDYAVRYKYIPGGDHFGVF